MKHTPKLIHLLYLTLTLKLLSGCFALQPFTPNDKINKKQLKKLPESEIIFEAKYAGTQTGTQLYFRKDSIFSLRTQTAFGWEQYNGTYERIETSDVFQLTYFNDHQAVWKYLVIHENEALLKSELSDTLPKKMRTFVVVKNTMGK